LDSTGSLTKIFVEVDAAVTQVPPRDAAGRAWSGFGFDQT
jgi:hypothetical protein